MSHFEIGGDPVQPAPLLPSPPEPPISIPPAPPDTPVPVPPVTPEPPAEPEPTLGEALPDLGKLAWLIVLLGLIALAAALVEAFNSLFRWMLGPLWKRTGSKHATPEQFTQWLSNPLGNAYSGLEADIGLSFQKLAQLTTGVGAAILGAETAMHTVAVNVAGLTGSLSGVQAAGAHAGAQAKSAAAAAAAAATAAHAASQRATAVEDGLQGQITGLTEHVHHVIEPELEALRSAIPELQHGATVAWDEISKHSEAIGAAGVVAATAYGLSQLGGSWIRCEGAKALGEGACGAGPQNVNNLLQLLLGASVLLDFQEYVKLMQDATKVAAEGMVAVLRV